MKHTLTINKITSKLFEECKKENFYGIDPYDGINSPLLSSRWVPKIVKIVFTQFSKLSCVSMRKIFRIHKHQNPKTLGLFALGLQQGNLDQETKIVIDKILQLKVNPEGGWGYPFPWQSRTFFQKKNEILVVPSCFVAKALFFYGSNYKRELDYLAIYFTTKLQKKIFDNGRVAFFYGQNDSSCIYNVSALVGDFLCTYGEKFNHPESIQLGLKALRFVANGQNLDGSWYYGTDNNQKWIDCIHTIYNLQALEKYPIFNTECEKGFEYLLSHFVDEETGSIGNFSLKKYPQEVHTIGAFIAYMSARANLSTRHLSIIQKSVEYLIYEFYDDKSHQFFYRKNKFFTNKIKYMRWSNAYAYYGLSTYYNKIVKKYKEKNYLTSNVMGIKVFNAKLADTLEYITAAVQNNEKLTQYSLNLNKIVEIKKNKSMEEVFERANIISADGFPILLLAKYFHCPVVERVTGVDLFLALLDKANIMGWRIAFFGSTQENLDKMKEIIEERYQNLGKTIYINGYYKKEHKVELEIVENINTIQPHLLFLGFSSPQKEYFMDQYKNNLKVNLCMGVGGSLDILTGKALRAPLWMQKTGLEWLYRTIQEPKRMVRRYAIGLVEFLVIFIRKGRSV